MDLVHDRGSMDPVHESGPWTRSKEGVHGPLVHVLSSPNMKHARAIKFVMANFLAMLQFILIGQTIGTISFSQYPNTPKASLGGK